ncbi:MAG: GerMN domain-containing protein [Armatimonadetes bacterium]|nr:GerMN domain-containing protein [Armatimonadota bacterium]
MRRQRRTHRKARHKTVNQARQVQGYLGIILVIIAIVAIGVGVWLRLTPPPPPKSAIIPPKVNVYLPKVSPQGEVDYDTKEVAASPSADPYRAPFEYLLQHASGFPQGTRLLRAERRDDTLILDFSKELTENFAGGSDDEAALINALTRTARGFPDIRKLQILVEGKPVESIGGHIDISIPLSVNP